MSIKIGWPGICMRQPQMMLGKYWSNCWRRLANDFHFAQWKNKWKVMKGGYKTAPAIPSGGFAACWLQHLASHVSPDTDNRPGQSGIFPHFSFVIWGHLVSFWVIQNATELPWTSQAPARSWNTGNPHWGLRIQIKWFANDSLMH